MTKASKDRRGSSNIIAAVLLVAIAVIGLVMAYKYFVAETRATSPKGSVVKVSVTASKHEADYGAYLVQGKIFIMCTGEDCGSYKVRVIIIKVYNRYNALSLNSSYEELVSLEEGNTTLAGGVVVIPFSNYCTINPTDLVATVTISTPSGIKSFTASDSLES